MKTLTPVVNAYEITCPSGFLYACEGDQMGWNELLNHSAKYNVEIEVHHVNRTTYRVLPSDGQKG